MRAEEDCRANSR